MDLRIEPIDGGAYEVAEHRVLGVFFNRAHAELFRASLTRPAPEPAPEPAPALAPAPGENAQTDAAPAPDPKPARAPAARTSARRAGAGENDPGAVRRRASPWSDEDDLTLLDISRLEDPTDSLAGFALARGLSLTECHRRIDKLIGGGGI